MSERRVVCEFKGKYEFLSNFYIVKNPIYYDGHYFQTTEHAYQAYKTLDLKQLEAIKNCSSPGEAKRLASNSKKTKLRSDWEKIKLPLMYDLLVDKFRGNPALSKMLYSLYGYHLEEGNWWHDNFWGNCYCEKCKDITGKNVLGKMLMRLIDRIHFFKNISQEKN